MECVSLLLLTGNRQAELLLTSFGNCECVAPKPRIRSLVYYTTYNSVRYDHITKYEIEANVRMVSWPGLT